MKLSDYKKVEKYRFMDLLEHKSKNGSPKYATYFSWFLNGPYIWVTDENNLTDLKIKIEENYDSLFNGGIVQGYPFRGGDFEEKYMGVGIGKFVHRERAIKLPKFAAMFHIVVDDDNNDESFKRVEGRTIADVKKEIRKILKTHKLRK